MNASVVAIEGKREYPWYATVTGQSLCQGDILTNYDVIVPDASGSGYSAQYQFRGIGTLKQMVKEDANLAAEIFKVCADIAKGGGEIPVNCLRGLYVLVLHMKDKENILSDKYIGKLKDIGMAGIEDAIRNEKYLAGKGGATVEAKAIIGLLNKGERRKLKWY